jgi:Protein of unknown function (DUF3631)/Domain of unknown function (DUF3854)
MNTNNSDAGLAANYLAERGLLLDTANENGVEIDLDIVPKKIVSRLNEDLTFGGKPLSQSAKELIWFPVRDGGKDSWICRPLPTIDPNRKFLTPTGGSGAPFIPRAVYNAKPGRPIIFTEGPIKALVCQQAGYDAIGLNGVWCGAVKLLRTGKLVLRKDLYEALDLRGRNAYIAFDADAAINPEVRNALIRFYLMLSAAGCEVHQLTSWDIGEGKGIDDFIIGQELSGEHVKPADTLKLLIDDAAPFHETITATAFDLQLVAKELARADITKLLRSQQCKKLAKVLKVNADDLLAASLQEEAEKEGFAADPEPWPDPVKGPELLTEITCAIEKHVILDHHFVVAAGLWVLLTYVADLVDCLPILAIVSPEKRCGKTRLLGVLDRMVRRAISASNISPAAVYRVVEEYCPTLLIDEADSFVKDKEELRGIIDSGHTRNAAYVVRVNNDMGGKIERFSTWAPKALASIGELPDTIADRSITIRLRRKVKGEKVKALRESSPDEWLTLRRKIMRWVVDNTHHIKMLEPAIPEAINDRAADSWFPLICIAYAIGSGWSEHALKAAVAINGGREDENESVTSAVLAGVKRIFEEAEENNDEGFLPTNQIIESLNTDNQAPWADWRNGDGISARKLGSILRQFGVPPYQTTTKPQVRGYQFRGLNSVFERYL